MHRHIINIICAFAISAAALVPVVASAQVRYRNEEADTARITAMLTDAAADRHLRTGERVVRFARMLEGTPYEAATLEGNPEMLTVDLDGMDCTTYVENVLAMALTLNERRTSWRDFVYNLQRIRYRGGVVNGYTSRLHYVTDWAVDNIHRGILTDATARFPRYSYVSRTLDFITENVSKYPALADSAAMQSMKSIEIGYRGFRFPYIKAIDLGNKDVKAEFVDGDIVAFVSKQKNLDVEHMGIIVIEKGEPYLLHASSSEKKVVMSKVPLADYVKRNRQFMGVRVFRLAE